MLLHFYRFHTCRALLHGLLSFYLVIPLIDDVSHNNNLLLISVIFSIYLILCILILISWIQTFSSFFAAFVLFFVMLFWRIMQINSIYFLSLVGGGCIVSSFR